MIAAIVAPRVTPGGDGEGGGLDEGHVLFLQLVAVRAKCVSFQSMMEILYFFLFRQSTRWEKSHRRSCTGGESGTPACRAFWRLIAPHYEDEGLALSSERTQRNGERADWRLWKDLSTDSDGLIYPRPLPPPSLSIFPARSLDISRPNPLLLRKQDFL